MEEIEWRIEKQPTNQTTKTSAICFSFYLYLYILRLLRFQNIFHVLLLAYYPSKKKS